MKIFISINTNMLIVKDFRLNTYIMTLKVTFISIYASQKLHL